MCTGRIDLSFVLRAFRKGADGVIIGGCWLGECHYVTEGNRHALSLMHLCRKLLEHAGVNPARLRLEWISASEGTRFAEVMNDFTRQVRAMGPLGQGEGIDAGDLASRLGEVVRLVPYVKIVMREKLGRRLERPEEFAGLFTLDEVDQLFRDAVSYYVDPEKCQACMICMRKCPEEAISGGKNRIHVIDQDRCIRCGTCFDVCPPRFGAVRKIAGAPVPAAVPEEQRAVVR